MESGVIPTGLEHVRQARVLEVELVSHSQLVRYAPRCEVVVACERHYALEAERLARRESIAPELGRDSLLPSVARNGPSDLDFAAAGYKVVLDQAPADAPAVVPTQTRSKAVGIPMSNLFRDDCLAFDQAKGPLSPAGRSHDATSRSPSRSEWSAIVRAHGP